MELSIPKSRKFLYIRGKHEKPGNQKLLIFCLCKENFSNVNIIEKNLKTFTFLYKEAKFSKLKYFLLIIKKPFFIL